MYDQTNEPAESVGQPKPYKQPYTAPGSSVGAGSSGLFEQLAKRAGQMSPMQPMSGPVPGQDGGLAPAGELGPRIDGGSIAQPMPMGGGYGGGIFGKMPVQPQGGDQMGAMLRQLMQRKQLY